MSRSLDFTVCTRPCAAKCWRKLTDEEKEWLKNNPNRQSYASFDDCENFKPSPTALYTVDRAELEGVGR